MIVGIYATFWVFAGLLASKKNGASNLTIGSSLILELPIIGRVWGFW